VVRRRRAWAAAALASISAVALASCGGSQHFGSGVPPPPTTATITTTSPTSTPTTTTTTRRSRVGVTTTTETPQTTTAPAATTTTVPPTLQYQPPAVPGSPEWVAARFVQVYSSLDYRWPNLGYWVTMAKPYMTPSLYSHFAMLDKRADNPSDAAYFAQIVKEQTVHAAEVFKSAVETNAPNTENLRYVLVTYEVIAFGLNEPDGGAPYGGTQAMQCTVVRSRPGAQWLVSEFQSPDAN